MDSPYKVSYDHSIQHFALSAIINEILAVKENFLIWSITFNEVPGQLWSKKKKVR